MIMASEIADYVGGRLFGRDIEVVGICSIDNLKPNHLAFHMTNNTDWLETIGLFSPSVVIVDRDFSIDDQDIFRHIELTYIVVDSPRFAHAIATKEFFPEKEMNASNGDGELSEHSFHGATIYDCVRWGRGCYFKPGTVIGHSGFGPEFKPDGTPILRDHVGGVEIGRNVHIGANSTVQRGTYDDTIIYDNVKIDAHCHIGHNCIIGRNTIITAGVIVCGTTKIGENCWIGVGSRIMQHITIGNNAKIGIGCNVIKSVPDNAVLAGFKAQPIGIMKKVAHAIETLFGV